eukprot:m.183339 g.183339  ORF g.183339 m.183339 type:complete len:292 (-) comp32161_c4_seq1:76-951(-)
MRLLRPSRSRLPSTYKLLKDLQTQIPGAEDDAAKHIQERSVGFDTSSSKVGDATVTPLTLEGDTLQHHVKTGRGLNVDENFTITVSGSKAVWVGVKNFKNDAADVATIFDLGNQTLFPNTPQNINVIVTRKVDKLVLSWDGNTGSDVELALTALGVDEEWVPVVATNDSKCVVHIVTPSFPYMAPGEIFENFLIQKNKDRLRNKRVIPRSDNKGYEDWCGLSYYNNPPGGFGDGKGTPMWICQDCRKKAEAEEIKSKLSTATSPKKRVLPPIPSQPKATSPKKRVLPPIPS